MTGGWPHAGQLADHVLAVNPDQPGQQGYHEGCSGQIVDRHCRGDQRYGHHGQQQRYSCEQAHRSGACQDRPGVRADDAIHGDVRGALGFPDSSVGQRAEYPVYAIVQLA